MTIEATLERIATALETLAAKAPVAGAPAEAPKARRGKTALAAETSATQIAPAAPAAETAPAKDPEATASKDDDLFGEEEKPAAPPETKKAEPKAKKLTLDDVRAALVAAQTALKSKDKAVALLTEVAGAAVLSKLKEEDFGKLIGMCNDAVAKAPK